MRLRSHLDPTIFVIFLHINSERYDEEFRNLVGSLRAKKGTDLTAVFQAISDRQYQTIAHERYHFWQGLRLPFLHCYANATWIHTFQGAGKLSRISEDWLHWDELVSSVQGFNRLDQIFYLSATNSGQLVLSKERVHDMELDLEFSVKEMLECAATIFDYHLSCQTHKDLSDPDCFKRWCKRNPAYLSIFSFLENLFKSDELTLRIILPLINAAFYTSVPERAFTELVATAWCNLAHPDNMYKDFLKQDEPCRWAEVFESWLSKFEYDYPKGSTPEILNFSDYKYYYLGKDFLGLTISHAFEHPFLGPLANLWTEKAKTIPGLDQYIDFPGYFSNTDAEKFAKTAEPQLRLVRIFAKDQPDKAFAIGEGLFAPAFKDEFFSQFSDSDFRGFIVDALAVYGAFRQAAGVHLNDVSRTCHHVDCPYYDKNYCNCYPLIPERHEDCGFPNRLSEWVVLERSRNGKVKDCNYIR